MNKFKRIHKRNNEMFPCSQVQYLSSAGNATLLPMHISCFFDVKTFQIFWGGLSPFLLDRETLFTWSSENFCLSLPFEIKLIRPNKRKKDNPKKSKLKMTKIVSKARGHGHFYNLVFAHFFIFSFDPYFYGHQL